MSDYMRQALKQGMKPNPPSSILRPRKFLNRRKKQAQWMENHKNRAQVNQLRAFDPVKNPNWGGIGRHSRLSK